MLGAGLGVGLGESMAMSPELAEEGLGGYGSLSGMGGLGGFGGLGMMGGLGMGGGLQMMELGLILRLLMSLLSGAHKAGNQNGSPSGGGGASGSYPGSFPGTAPVGSTGGTGSSPTASAASAAPTSGETPQMANFLNIAKAQSGKPYVYGTQGPSSFDCSGLVDYALNKAGVKVPRDSAEGYMQMFSKDKVDTSGSGNEKLKNLKPGDLLYYYFPDDGTSPGQASHIEIYLGNGLAMGAHDPQEGCGVAKVDTSALIGAERVPQLQ
jgi:cell wall-associated NlpC family hydrolase